jgi:hypothetical protein
MRSLAKLFTLALFVYTFGASTALAESRCQADLARVDTDFCIANAHSATDTSLKYTWKVNDDEFGITSPVCLNGNGGNGDRQDLIIAIDRSQNIWGADAGNKKLGADNLTTTKRIIEKLQTEAESGTAPKVGLMMFSNTGNCQEWSGADIYANESFPCLYIPARAITDATHVDLLKSFLLKAEGLYAEGGQASTSNYSIVADALKANAFALEAADPAGVLLMSDGRTYKGDAGDTYAYLKSENYKNAQSTALTSFSSADMRRYSLVFALNPLANPAFDNTHSDAMENMCALPGAPQNDCAQGFVNPSQWLINKLDIKGFALNLVESLGGSSSHVVSLDEPDSIDPALEVLRYGKGAANLEAVSYSIDGGSFKTGTVSGNRVTIEGLPSGEVYDVELLITASGTKVSIPMGITTSEVAYDGSKLEDREMVCGDTLKPKTEDPDLNLKNLQGGSASCGVITDKAGAYAPVFGMLLFGIPLLFVLAFTLRRYLGLIVILSLAGLSLNPTSAEAKSQGLNALQYRPVNDGVGSADKAQPTAAGNLNAGVYMDYANDAVEIGGEKNSRVQSIMDDMVTAHAVLDYGLSSTLSMGVHLPYVQQSDVDRSIEGDNQTGGQLGQPADTNLYGKWMVRNHYRLSVTLMPLITLPTGNPELLLGDGSTSFGAMVVLSGMTGKFRWAYNAGYMHREKPLVLSDDRTKDVVVRGHALQVGGVTYQLLPQLSFSGNLQWKISAGENIDFTRSNPAEWSASTKFKPAADYSLETGFGTGIGKGYGSPDYRVWAGVAWVPQPSRATRGRTIAKRK